MSAPHRLIVASRNPGKAKELAALLGDLPLEVHSLGDYPSVALPEETGETFEANAVLKARTVSLATGEWALADDSGLVVPALDGAPGLHSSRVAPTDAERLTWLLDRMEGRTGAARRAHFLCVLALTNPNGGTVLTATGRVDGRLVTAPRGEGGFGYDPVFLYEPTGQTFAEMTPEEKAAVSHRGQALRVFRAELQRLLRRNGGDG
jgi:XTP/dITP diphosphohydrolase